MLQDCPKAVSIAYYLFNSILFTTAQHSNPLDTATLRLVHIYAYTTFMNGREFPEMFGPRTPISYVFNGKDTITLKPNLKLLNHAVRSIEVFDVTFNRTDTLVIEYLQHEWNKHFRLTYRVLPGDSLPEFVSMAVERVTWFFKKTDYLEFVFVPPNIKKDVLYGIRNRMKTAKINRIDVRTGNE